VKKRVCREGKKNKNISGGRKRKAEAYMGEGVISLQRVVISVQRGVISLERGVSAKRGRRGVISLQREGKCREGVSAKRGKVQASGAR
jgi:hypothetical protein